VHGISKSIYRLNELVESVHGVSKSIYRLNGLDFGLIKLIGLHISQAQTVMSNDIGHTMGSKLKVVAG
jgi:hypothetical protein